MSLTTCNHCGGTGLEYDHIETGAEMRRLRQERGLSQRWMAEQMGHSAAYLSDLERGRRNWTTALVGKYIATLERVAEEETE